MPLPIEEYALIGNSRTAALLGGAVRGRWLIAPVEIGHLHYAGGNVKHLRKLPSDTRRCDKAIAFTGGFRLWERSSRRSSR
ncbi:MAG: hypothetical protein KGK44_09935 [Gammaproteobacteria bacterium]|nr:hypothetical protein [Gammaproteobacteria bacterium]